MHSQNNQEYTLRSKVAAHDIAELSAIKPNNSQCDALQRLYKKKQAKKCRKAQNVLCKVIFKLDQINFQLPIYPQTKLSELSEDFLCKINNQIEHMEGKKSIEQQLVQRLQQMIQQQNNQHDIQWKCQLQKVIKQYYNRKQEQNKKETNHHRIYFTLENTNQIIERRFIQTPTNSYGNTQPILNKQPQSSKNLSIYERSINNLVVKKEKILQYKKQKKQAEIKQCTFQPKVNIKKSNESINIFCKLYEQAKEIEDRKQERLRTIQSEEQERISGLSFAPEINECSRQIVRIKTKNMSEMNSATEQCHNYDDILRGQCCTTVIKKHKNNLPDGRNIKQKPSYENKFPFHPQLSNGTRKIAENLPKFDERMAHYQNKLKSKKGINQHQNYKNIGTSMSMTNLQHYKHHPKDLELSNMRGNRNNCSGLTPSSQIKKQRITIDIEEEEEQEEQSDNAEPSKLYPTAEKISKSPKKDCNRLCFNKLNLSNQSSTMKKQCKSRANGVKIAEYIMDQNADNNKENQSKSKKLYNERKIVVFRRIFQFITVNPQLSIYDYSQMQDKIKGQSEVSAQLLVNHKYLPKNIKQLLKPLAKQMSELNISLNSQQFIWSIQKIYQSLSMSAKGSFLGWGVKLLPISHNTAFQ